MALRYPNKVKRDGYWVRYERSKQFDFKKVWELIIVVVEKVGLPFELTESAKAQLKFKEEKIYAAIPIFMTYYDYTEREMQYELQSLVGDTLNHGNINRWFQRCDPNYVQEAIKLLDTMITKIYGEEDHYVGDSTGISTTLYKQVISAEEIILKLITNKLHILISYFEKYGVLVIKKSAVTHGDANDSPVFREHLIKGIKLIPGKYVHLDKGYDAEDNMKACFDRGLIPNIVEKENDSGGMIRIKARKLYDNELRKKIRGMVEGVFGGTETAYSNKTRRRKNKCKEIYIQILALSHNIKTYFRALVDPFI